MVEQQKEKDAEMETNRPALFQRDSRLSEERKKQLMEQSGIDTKDLDEQMAYKEMNDKLDVDFSKDDVEDHEKMREFFNVSKDKG